MRPEVETYLPVTIDSIEKDALKVVYIRDEWQAARIALIQDTDVAFDPQLIRVKITKGDKSYTFDENGIGQSSAGKPVKVDIKQLADVLSW